MGRGDGFEPVAELGGMGGLFVGVVSRLVIPGLIDHEPIGPARLLQKSDARVSCLFERSVAVLFEQRDGLVCRARRNIEICHAIDGASAGLGLCSRTGRDHEQEGQTQCVFAKRNHACFLQRSTTQLAPGARRFDRALVERRSGAASGRSTELHAAILAPTFGLIVRYTRGNPRRVARLVDAGLGTVGLHHFLTPLAIFRSEKCLFSGLPARSLRTAFCFPAGRPKFAPNSSGFGLLSI
jgi:hypothetical protein